MNDSFMNYKTNEIWWFGAYMYLGEALCIHNQPKDEVVNDFIWWLTIDRPPNSKVIDIAKSKRRRRKKKEDNSSL